jgi:hypothetical protein
VHVVAPVLAKLSVAEPASQTLQATVDTLLYCPAAHASHVAAPAKESVLVIDPAPHTAQAVFSLMQEALVDWTQLAFVVGMLYRPAGHSVQVVGSPNWS